jgi:hypothetical protein
MQKCTDSTPTVCAVGTPELVVAFGRRFGLACEAVEEIGATPTARTASKLVIPVSIVFTLTLPDTMDSLPRLTGPPKSPTA